MVPENEEGRPMGGTSETVSSLGGRDGSEATTSTTGPQALPTPRTWSTATGETSRAAAKIAAFTSSETCRAIRAAIAARGDATAEEAHTDLIELGHDAVLNTIRARISDMARVGMLTATARRGVSASGRCRSIAWRLSTPEELEGAQ